MMMIEVNVDASVITTLEYFGVRLVGRDSSGAILFTEGKILQGCFSLHLVEMFAIREGITSAISLGWSKIMIEFDAITTVQAIHQHEHTPWTLQ